MWKMLILGAVLFLAASRLDGMLLLSASVGAFVLLVISVTLVAGGKLLGEPMDDRRAYVRALKVSFVILLALLSGGYYRFLR